MSYKSHHKRPSEEPESDPVGELIVGSRANVIKIASIPEFHNGCRCTDPENTKIVKAFERMARNSLEYKNYFYYLKHNLDMSRCSYLPFIRTGIGDIHIELHHSPFTMFDITKAVVSRQIEDHGYADEFDVAQEVMQLHYENLVGIIPLSPTVHELVHSQAMDVHPRLTYGYWKEFIHRYRDYFTEDLELKVQELSAWEDVPTDRMPPILTVKYTMLQYEGLPLYKTLALEDHSNVESELGLNDLIQDQSNEPAPTIKSKMVA